MKTAKLHCWTRTKWDTRRDTASGTIVIEVPQDKALAIARKLENYGDPAGEYSPADNRIAAGHGILVVYNSGRRRRVCD